MEFFRIKELYYALVVLNKDQSFINVQAYYNGVPVEIEEIPHTLYKSIIDCSVSLQKYRGKLDMEVIIMKKGTVH